MNKKPLLSIIVPVYNAENYLHKCVDSLIHQTLKDLEIILVNDCSTDHSQEIIDEYVKKDSRVKSVIHEKNSGAAGPGLNSGLEIVQGKYITFVGNDDWLDLNAYQYLCERIEKEKVDIIGFEYKSVAAKDQLLSISQMPLGLLKNQEIAKAYLNNQITVALWNKIYTRELFEDQEIRFPAYIYEDLGTSFHILCKAKTFLQISEPFYHYHIRENSVVRSIVPKTVSDYALCFDQIRKIAIQYQIENYEQDLKVLISNHLNWSWRFIASQKNINSEIFAKFYQEMSTLFGQIGIEVLSKFVYQNIQIQFENQDLRKQIEPLHQIKWLNRHYRLVKYQKEFGWIGVFKKIVGKVIKKIKNE